MSVLVPGARPAILRDSSLGEAIFSPSTETITSPDAIPACMAGVPSWVSATMAPSSSAMPSDSAISWVTGWIETPSQPRSTLPSSRRSAMTCLAVDAGMAKAMPTLPPDGEKMAVLMPTTLPFRLKAGPPELPWFTAASIWMKSS